MSNKIQCLVDLVIDRSLAIRIVIIYGRKKSYVYIKETTNLEAYTGTRLVTLLVSVPLSAVIFSFFLEENKYQTAISPSVLKTAVFPCVCARGVVYRSLSIVIYRSYEKMIVFLWFFVIYQCQVLEKVT